MVLIMSNPSEDSQGTQLRVNKKLTTVCSGKRSRFSKPRPNLSISKRGETNIPANDSKTSRSSDPEICQTVLDLNTDSKSCIFSDKTSKKDTQNHLLNVDINKDSQKTAISHEVVSYKDLDSKKTIEENIKNLSEDNVFKSSHEEDIKVLSYKIQNKNVKEDSIENDLYEDDKKLVSEEVALSDNIEYQISNTENLSSDKESQAARNPYGNNTSKDCDIESSPTKNLGSSLKSSESEKRNNLNITPTVIDKSKYPHLTSILSKKRTEPKKEIQQKRKRKFRKGDIPPERNKMTMADLIYWNPAKTNEPQKTSTTESETSSINVIIEEENVDDSFESESNVIDSVPKLVISEDGQINIDQSSLFVSRNIPQPTTTEVIRKDDTTYSSFRKRPLTKHWTTKDTANFYRALSLVGADFSLMEQIFPNRTRRELKQKFKREEKFNIDLINKVLYESQTYDEITLNAFIDQNNMVYDPVPMNEKDADVIIKEKSRKKRTSEKTASFTNDESATNRICDSSIDHLAEEITLENEKTKPKNKKRNKIKKLSDDEYDTDTDIDCSNFNDTGELKSSKRKRCAKKLPNDFINFDSLEELKIWNDNETNNKDASEQESAIEYQENTNDIETEITVEEISSESACAILDKIMNKAENTDNEEKYKEKVCAETISLPVITNHDEEYISVEYIKNDLDTDLCMLSNVVAYEVVNTQTPPPRKRRKLNSISPVKTRDYFVSTKISPASYTNYTPV